jgi:hypothetical protein
MKFLLKFSQFQKRKLAKKTEFYDRPNCARVQDSLLILYVDGDIRGGGGETALEISGGEYQTKGNCIVKRIKWSWGTKKIIFIFSSAHRFASLQEFDFSQISIMSQDEQLCSDEI